MNLPKRLRNIAKTQINNIKERLDRIDLEAEEEVIQKRYERDARAELDDISDIRLPMRSPEEIAGGRVAPSGRSADRPASSGVSVRPEGADAPARPPVPVAAAETGGSLLGHHYRVLGVEEGSDFATVQAAYSKLAARCSPDRFAEGSDERKTAEEIRKRVDAAFEALRDALDSTAGRFDKLEF